MQFTSVIMAPHLPSPIDILRGYCSTVYLLEVLNWACMKHSKESLCTFEECFIISFYGRIPPNMNDPKFTKGALGCYNWKCTLISGLTL